MEVLRRNSLYGFEMREPDNRRAEGPRKANIKQLWQSSHEIIALAVQGHKQADIARILGISPVTVSNTLNSELGMQKLSEMRRERDKGVIDVSKRAAELAAKAMQVYEQIFDDEAVDLDLKKKTADTIVMDICGHRAATKIDKRSVTAIASLDEIESFKKRGIEAARQAGMLATIETKAIEHKEGESVE